MANQVRHLLRNAFFNTLDRALATDDGRRIAVGALSGLLASRPTLPAAVLEAAAPYPDLGQVPEARPTYEGTVFITARFRTGSTLLWNLFRQLDDCVAYYEPLNERRWFDPVTRGTRLDATHRGVDDYWREYEGLGDLGSIYREEWVDRGLLLDESAWQPQLRSYIERLIRHAGPRRAVLQFNRVDFRLPWLRRQFPGATIVHLYRHPRDQWCSSLVTPDRVPRDVELTGFERFDHFYLARWGRDLSRHFPFLSDQMETCPYRLFYFIWKLSFLFGAAYADHAISFEALAGSPSREIGRLLEAVSLPGDVEALTRIVGAPPPSRRHEYASDEWYAQQEARCEAVLAEFFRGQPSPQNGGADAGEAPAQQPFAGDR
jgi:hypothetical protein